MFCVGNFRVEIASPYKIMNQIVIEACHLPLWSYSIVSTEIQENKIIVTGYQIKIKTRTVFGITMKLGYYICLFRKMNQSWEPIEDKNRIFTTISGFN